MGMANEKGKMALATSARCSGDQDFNASLYLDMYEVLTKIRRGKRLGCSSLYY